MRKCLALSIQLIALICFGSIVFASPHASVSKRANLWLNIYVVRVDISGDKKIDWEMVKRQVHDGHVVSRADKRVVGAAEKLGVLMTALGPYGDVSIIEQLMTPAVDHMSSLFSTHRKISYKSSCVAPTSQSVETVETTDAVIAPGLSIYLYDVRVRKAILTGTLNAQLFEVLAMRSATCNEAGEGVVMQAPETANTDQSFDFRVKRGEVAILPGFSTKKPAINSEGGGLSVNAELAVVVTVD
jgi:hypothetical protein